MSYFGTIRMARAAIFTAFEDQPKRIIQNVKSPVDM